MVLDYLSEFAINNFISLALAEDVGDGDYSSNACVPEDAVNKAHLLVKDNGVLAGVNLAEKIFLKVDANIKFDLKIKDGTEVNVGDVAFIVEGSARSILKAERLALNCMQRMSAIATYTKYMSGLISHTSTKLLDTRKTTPNFRMCEKWAVVIGGGMNHRYNLCDMVMLKDNHLDYAGGVKPAIEKTNAYLKEKSLDLKIEVETRDLQELDEVLAVGNIHRIMLDNFSLEDLKTAIEKIEGKYETEASGGITEATIAAIAETGVDYISVGALTHSVKSLDMSLKAIN